VFELDPRAGELRKRGLKVRLQQQPSELLHLLLEQPGEVVTREAIRKRLWPADVFVDFDRGLNKAIVKLREALGDSADSPRFIETLPRKGYRFIAPVGAAEPVAGGGGLGESAESSSPARHSTSVILVAAALVLALAAGIVVLVKRDRLFGGPMPAGPRSIAVLPLENLSGDPGQNYFADGMTEALINDLGKISALRVISRTSVNRYKGTRKPLSEVARELGVYSVVEGTVARSGNRVRVTANLVQASSPERHLWAETYERDLQDILALQTDLARAIAHGVQATLTRQELLQLTSHRRVDPESYELYLQGRAFCMGGPGQNLWKGRDRFEQAVRKDPGFALGYAWLAIAYDYLAENHEAPANEVMPKAKAAALKALELDDTLAEAHASLSVILLEYDWDWAGSEREIKRALELNPNSSMALRAYTWFLIYQGRFDEALVKAHQLVEMISLGGHVTGDLENVLVYARRDVEAEKQLRETLSDYPDVPSAHRHLATIHLRRGEYPAAIAEYQRAQDLSGRVPSGTPSLSIAYAKSLAGEKGEAQQMLASLQERAQGEHVPPATFAILETGLGDKDKAFEYLEKAYSERAIAMISLKIEPAFDPLRSDPRFADLLRRMGFPP
jgi:TolB-like protein/DNA-binding winged helix-turn-helix (wHTH) protein/Tfp pilus assembly protein PilF